MKYITTVVLSLLMNSSLAGECISYGERGYKINFPDEMRNFSIDGDSVAYCAKFDISAVAFKRWLTSCGIELEALHHGGDIKEIKLPNGLITIIDTEKGDEVFIEVINSNDEKVFREHIGVQRGCTL